MNFGKKGVQRKKEQLDSSSTMMGKKAGISALRVLFLSIIAFCTIVICLGVGAYRGIIDSAPDISDAVSYTHLDVYKRQVMSTSRFKPS